METPTYLIANYNNAVYLPDCLDSLLAQTDPQWRAICCDDASDDDSAALLGALSEPRIKVIANAHNRGYIAVLKQLIAAAETDLVAILDADDALMPEATARLRAAAAAHPQAGLIWSRFAFFDAALCKPQGPGGWPPRPDSTSLASGFISHLKAFRRSAYARTDGLDEALRYAEDRDLIYQLEELGEPVFIDAVLYCHRMAAGSQSRDPDKYEIGLRHHREAAERALRRRAIGGWRATLYRLHFGLRHASQTRRLPRALSALANLAWRALQFVDARLGLLAKGCLRRAPRVGYYLWRYPLHGETFICREVAAVRAAGVDLHLIADRPGELAPLDPDTRALAGHTDYLLPEAPLALSAAFLGTLVRDPVWCLSAWRRARASVYGKEQGALTDLRVALKAARLARWLRARRIDRAHSPWGAVNAWVLRLATRLAGVDYSVEFRAQELHRRVEIHALHEKMDGARCVVANCRFNLDLLRPHLPDPPPPLHVVYEGLELAQFPPVQCCPPGDGPLRLLSVARLIDCKGLDVLLRACARLRQAGFAFRCRIIGGPEPAWYPDYPGYLMGLRDALGLAQAVEFAGGQPFPVVRAAYADADLFVLPVVTGADGTRDITPNALLEAMASGLAVISSRQTAIPEIVEDGISGVLIEPGDDARLADVLIELGRDPARRAALGVAARQRIAERFAIEVTGRRLAELLSLG